LQALNFKPLQIQVYMNRIVLLAGLFLCQSVLSQTNEFILLKADRLFDGVDMHNGWSVLIKGNTIAEVGVINIYPGGTVIKTFKGTIMPGMIEGHSHLFLHPYNETTWNDQVLNESRAERTARAVNHAKATLMAGFTMVRDLGTEGAAYDDAGLKRAIQKGVIPGPRMLVATKAIVAKGAYGPHPENGEVEFPQGAAEVSGVDDMMREVRLQISKGADVIKLYADYSWGKNGETRPTLSQQEMATAVAVAHDAGLTVVAHAAGAEGMRRAVMAGVATVEHGDDGTKEVFELMKEKMVAFCPTLAAGDATSQYRGWKKGMEPEPARIQVKRKTFQLALQA